jgi:hypothetical protein
MMINVHYGQSLMDVALQYYGSADALPELAADNGLAIDASIAAGDALLVRDEAPAGARSIFSDYLRENGIRVVSGDTGTSETALASNDDEIISTNNNNGLQI